MGSYGRMETTGRAVASAMCLCVMAAFAIHGQEPRHVSAFVASGDSRGFGGFDYFGRSMASVIVGIDVPVAKSPRGLLLLGAEYNMRRQAPDGHLDCLLATRRACMETFPSFNTASLALTWRQKVAGFVGDFAFRPSIFLSPSGRPRVLFGPGASMAADHAIWNSLGLFLRVSGTYLPSYQGQRLGFRDTSLGLRIW